jgi:hypothetical protein
MAKQWYQAGCVLFCLPHILQTEGSTLQFHQWAPVGESGHFQSPEARYSFSITPMGFLEKFAIRDLLYMTYFAEIRDAIMWCFLYPTGIYALWNCRLRALTCFCCSFKSGVSRRIRAFSLRINVLVDFDKSFVFIEITSWVLPNMKKAG